MLVITTLSIVALAATYGLSRLRVDAGERLMNPHGEIMTVGVQIICGDCSGDGAHPVKTYLDRLGKCGQCGGRSYVLASVCAQYRIIGLATDSRERDRGWTPPVIRNPHRVVHRARPEPQLLNTAH